MWLLDTCNVVSASEELDFQLYLNSYVWLMATSLAVWYKTSGHGNGKAYVLLSQSLAHPCIQEKSLNTISFLLISSLL